MLIIQSDSTKPHRKAALKRCFLLMLAAAMLLTTSCNSRRIENDTAAYALAADNVGTATSTSASTSNTSKETQSSSFDYTLCFAGDISVSDEARTTAYWISQDRDITKCIHPEMIDHMQAADICFVNNEFQYSKRGTALIKNYTFRGDPKNVQVMQDLGVDIVSLANNHVYDFGEDALLDTMSTLTDADIPFVGAGKNLEEASATYFYDLGNFRVAFVSGTRVEWTEQTKGATETEPGVFRTVDPTLLYQRVKEASCAADYVVVYMHWGEEAVTWQEEYQIEVGHGLIAAGADAVIGDHPHRVQGIEYYDGKPILYSLGNFWFNGMSMDTMLAELHISGTADDYEVSLQLIPGRQENCQVRYYDTPEEQDAFYRNMETLSSAYGITVDEDGFVSPLQ